MHCCVRARLLCPACLTSTQHPRPCLPLWTRPALPCASANRACLPAFLPGAQRLLDYIKPDFVHIMQSGQIVKTGDMTLVDQLEAGGYATLSDNE